MNQSQTERQTDTAAASGGARIAFVLACWHRDIVDRAREACLEELARHGIGPEQVDLYEVPGSLEIPLQAQLLARSGRYHAIIAAGFVVDGGIYRHEFVAAAVIDAMMRVQLDEGVPIISCVLTPQRFHEHDEHRDFFRRHFLVKGREAAEACLATLANMQALKAAAAAA